MNIMIHVTRFMDSSKNILNVIIMYVEYLLVYRSYLHRKLDKLKAG